MRYAFASRGRCFDPDLQGRALVRLPLHTSYILLLFLRRIHNIPSFLIAAHLLRVCISPAFGRTRDEGSRRGVLPGMEGGGGQV